MLLVIEAMRDQRNETMGKSVVRFPNQYGKPLDPDSTNYHVWKPALKKVGWDTCSSLSDTYLCHPALDVPIFGDGLEDALECCR